MGFLVPNHEKPSLELDVPRLAALARDALRLPNGQSGMSPTVSPPEDLPLPAPWMHAATDVLVHSS
jgi:hypothetical protein